MKFKPVGFVGRSAFAAAATGLFLVLSLGVSFAGGYKNNKTCNTTNAAPCTTCLATDQVWQCVPGVPSGYNAGVCTTLTGSNCSGTSFSCGNLKFDCGTPPNMVGYSTDCGGSAAYCANTTP